MTQPHIHSQMNLNSNESPNPVFFDEAGHVTDPAIHALIADEEMDLLYRLELSEHFSFCDDCLARYTGLLEKQELAIINTISESPKTASAAPSARRPLKNHITSVVWRSAVSAAAAVLTLILWQAALPRIEAAQRNRERIFEKELTSMSSFVRNGMDFLSDGLSESVGAINNLFTKEKNTIERGGFYEKK